PHLTRLRRLELDGWRGRDLPAILDLPGLTQRLEALDLSHLGPDWDGMADLVARPWPRLRRLWFGKDSLNADAVRTLWASGLWSRLDGRGLGAVVRIHQPDRAALFPAVERLNASSLSLPRYTDASLDDFAAMADARTWGRLRSLTIRGPYGSAESLARLL